jgi:hypothetical protein
MPVEVYIDDIVRLRKVHPCGSHEWRVVRLGADIGLKCLKCGHRILLPRSTFERRLKAFVSRGETPLGPEGQRQAQTTEPGAEKSSTPQDTVLS